MTDANLIYHVYPDGMVADKLIRQAQNPSLMQSRHRISRISQWSLAIAKSWQGLMCFCSLRMGQWGRYGGAVTVTFDTVVGN